MQKVTVSAMRFLLAVALVAIMLIQPAEAGIQLYPSTHTPETKPNAANGTRKGANLLYHNGPVMAATIKAYAIFWEPLGTYVSPDYHYLILRYFRDVGDSPLYHNNTQYHDMAGRTPVSSTLGGFWIDAAPYPDTRLSDTQIQNEVRRALNVNGWSANLASAFFVFTARNITVCNGLACSFSQFCAYHSFFDTNVIYAAIPYANTSPNTCGAPVSPNGDPDADSSINITSHEHMEMVTNPLLNAWIDAAGEEIGDKCAWNFGGLATFNGHSYFVQKEWNNAKGGCTASGP